MDACGCCPHAQKAKDGRNALHWASRNGCASVVKWLVEDKGISPDVETHDGTVPLHWASWQVIPGPLPDRADRQAEEARRSP